MPLGGGSRVGDGAVALFPDYEAEFGTRARIRATKFISRDPLILNYGDKSDDDRLVLASLQSNFAVCSYRLEAASRQV